MFDEPAPGIDVHYDIVRLSPPPEFESEAGEITFASGTALRTGQGCIKASLTALSGEITYEDPLKPGEVRTFTGGTPGRLIADDEYALVTPVVPAMPSWSADGGYITNTSLHPFHRYAHFQLSSVSVVYADGPIAFTREVFRGPRIEYLRFFTGNGRGGATADRLEHRALGRRTTIRNLAGGEGEPNDLIAIVYDGEPYEGILSQAIWLGASLLAGQNLQSVVTETYDLEGTLLVRRYRLGASAATNSDPPFHVHYAPFDPDWLDVIIGGIAKALDNSFPIDVVIAHLHDATDGSIERRMQSYLLALHAASESWNRRHGKTTIIPKEHWSVWSTRIGAIAGIIAGFVHSELATAVRAKIGDANHTGTGARMRAFCGAMGLAFAGADKKAVNLRNVLFHDGYLQRRFKDLTPQQRQERVDQVDRLRDFTYRAMFSLIDFGGSFHGALHRYKAIPVKNSVDEPDGQRPR